MAGLVWFDIAKTEGEMKGPPYRKSWVLVSEKTCGAQGLAMGVNETQVGGAVPEHKHEKEEEVMFFIQGKGQFITKNETIELKPGICVYNPPGEYHQIKNTGDEFSNSSGSIRPSLKAIADRRMQCSIFPKTNGHSQ